MRFSVRVLHKNYKVSLSSGNEKTQYYLSGNYMSQTGVVIESKNERYQAKANVTSQILPWLHVTTDINASHSIRKGGSFVTGKENPIWIAMNYSPTMQMMDGNNYAKDPDQCHCQQPGRYSSVARWRNDDQCADRTCRPAF